MQNSLKYLIIFTLFNIFNIFYYFMKKKARLGSLYSRCQFFRNSPCHPQEKDNSKKSTRDIKRQRTSSIGNFSAGCGALWVTYGRGHLLITLECSAGVRHVSSWSTASRRMPHDFSWMSWSQIITNLQECRNTWPEDFPAYLVLGWLMKIMQHQPFLRWKPMVMGRIQFSQTPIAKAKIWEARSPRGSRA